MELMSLEEHVQVRELSIRKWGHGAEKENVAFYPVLKTPLHEKRLDRLDLPESGANG
jgi:hypothetical protein